MLSSLRQCAVTLAQVRTSRSRSYKTFKGQSTHARVRAIIYVCIDGLSSNLVQMLSLLRRRVYIQEYLGYQSNLYFLFSHSWPVVVYNFGQVQGTSQDERKTKCSKKNNGEGYSRPLDFLVEIIVKHCLLIRSGDLNQCYLRKCVFKLTETCIKN